jgi:toluene monooxygenase electron transfer component
VAPRRLHGWLQAKRRLTPDMIELTFRVDQPAEFLPGQYALLYPPATTGARAYSMSNLSNPEGLWQFVIRRVEGGRGSNALFDQVGIGEMLVLDGPYGHAFLRADSRREIVCIAGGSGLAPMVSIARAALAQGVAPRLHFFDGARTQADLCAKAILDAIPGTGTQLTYTPVLSAVAGGEEWAGARGFVHAEVERRLPQPLDQYEFYFAGPPPMIEALQTLLMIGHHVPYQQIHFDRFV